MQSKPVTDYIAEQPEPQKSAIKRVYDTARQIAGSKNTEESVNYGMPCLRYKGLALVSVMNTKNHIGLYPYSGFPAAEMGGKLKGFSVSPGTIRFTADKPLPDDLLTEIIATRIQEIEAKITK